MNPLPKSILDLFCVPLEREGFNKVLLGTQPEGRPVKAQGDEQGEEPWVNPIKIMEPVRAKQKQAKRPLERKTQATD